MVASSQRDREVRRLLTEVQLNRNRMLQQLSRDYRDTFDRLNMAYDGALDSINDELSDYDGSSRAGTRLTNRLRSQLKGMETIISDESLRLQENGLQIGGRVGVQNMNAGGMSVRFNQTTAEALQGAVDYVDSRAFRDAVNGYSDFHAGKVADIILTAQNEGWNPRRTAGLIDRYLTRSKNPMVDAQRLTRTTQIYASRQGTRAIYERTGIEFWIWTAAIGDSRTCLSCIAQHGTVHPVSEVLNDHHNGRCAPVPVTPKWRDLGLMDGNDPQIETGVDWFNKQPGDVQAQLMGPQLFDAFQNGEFMFTPAVVSGEYDNPIFGTMRRRKTNAEILGG